MTNKKHNYDWDAMEFDPGKVDVVSAFVWSATPQGIDWWVKNAFSPEGKAEFARMKRLYAEDRGAKEGPIRTVTTRLVPNECVIGHVEVTKHGNIWIRHVTTADELTDAIETLIQIRDALEA